MYDVLIIINTYNNINFVLLQRYSGFTPLSSTHYPRALSLDPALDFKIGTCRLATSRYLPSLAHQVIVLKMHPRGALLFEGPLALRMPRDKKEAVRSEGIVKGVVTLNSSVEEQLSVEFVIKVFKTTWIFFLQTNVGLKSLDGRLRVGELIRRVHDGRVYRSGVTVGS